SAWLGISVEPVQETCRTEAWVGAGVRRLACPVPRRGMKDEAVRRHYVKLMRKRRPGLQPNCCGLMKCSTRMPPFASMTRCDAMLSGSVVISTYGRPTALASGSIRRSADLAYPRCCFHGTTA